MTITRFAAAPDASRERITLLREVPSRVPFKKPAVEIVPFADWTLARPAAATAALARLLEALEDGRPAHDGTPLAIAEEGVASLHPAFVAALSEGEAEALGLPSTTRLALDLQSRSLVHKSDFRIDARWVKLGGIPASVRVDGARIRHDGRDWRVPEPAFSTLAIVEEVNAAADDAARQAALSRLKRTIGDEASNCIATDGTIARLRIAYASGFSLAISASARGFDFDPVLFSRERLDEAEEGAALDEGADGLLPPALAAGFTKRFRQGDGTRRAYLLDDGSLLFLDPQLTRMLGAVRTAQKGSAEARKAFARNPERAIAEALRDDGGIPADTARLFVETQQFSERVAGIDVWRKPVLPWIKPKPNSWLPEKFGLWIGDPPQGAQLEITPADVPYVREAAEAARVMERPSFGWGGLEVPATSQTFKALDDIAELLAAAGAADRDEDAGKRGEAALPPIARERYFLQVRDNLEDVAFAPIAAAAPAPVLPPPAMPETLLSSPKPHQRDGFAWLAGCWRAGIPGVLLADDMGLGKTFQALAFLAWVRGQDPHPKPVLIAAPTGLLANWRAEIARHLAAGALGPVVAAYGTGLARLRDDAGRDIDLGESRVDVDAFAHAGVVLTTYETMRDYHLSFARQRFAAIVYDEVQKLKNPASQMTRAAKTLNARFQLAMTGTPVENRLQDLWSIYDVVHPGLLGSSKQFESDYPAAAPERLKALHDLLARPSGGRPALLLRRMKDDCLAGLPQKTVRALPVPMPPRQRAAYDRVIGRALAVKGSGERGRMLEILQHLRGVSLHPVSPEEAGEDAAYFEDSARLATLFALLEEIAAKHEKVLIFCESLAMQALLAVEIRRRFTLAHAVARISGEVGGDRRQSAVDAFQTRGAGFDAMILSPKAGGVGLTLTAANHVIHLSRWWNPAVEDQATDRAYRIGQTRDVTVYLPQAVHPDPAVAPTSFDVKLHDLMERKRTLSRGLLAPNDDDADASALFDAVVTDASPEPAVQSGAPPEPEPGVEAARKAPRRILSVPRRPAVAPAPASAPAARSWPMRVVFAPNTARDLSIFCEPIAADPVVELTMVDPYAVAGDRARDHVVRFADMLLKENGGALERAQLITYDAESVDIDRPESSDEQYEDMQTRWRRRFGAKPALHHVQRSKRQSRDLHDREVRVTTRSGRTLIWDLGRGIDGVMGSRFGCRVNLTED